MSKPEQAPEGPERMDWRAIFNVKGDMTDQLMDAYFEPFAHPTLVDGDDGEQTIDYPCLKCGTQQLGFTAAMLGGGFQWGLAHGEGVCSKCGWPARAMHYLKDDDGKEIGAIDLLLQYHPDFVTSKQETSDE